MKSVLVLVGDLLSEESLYFDLQLAILYADYLYRGRKDHKVFKGEKDPKVKGFLGQRYFFKSIIRE